MKENEDITSKKFRLNENGKFAGFSCEINEEHFKKYLKENNQKPAPIIKESKRVNFSQEMIDKYKIFIPIIEKYGVSEILNCLELDNTKVTKKNNSLYNDIKRLITETGIIMLSKEIHDFKEK